MYTADNICKMTEFLIHNIFAQFGGCLFHQVIGSTMGTNCAPLHADHFLYLSENEFLDNMAFGKLTRTFLPRAAFIFDSDCKITASCGESPTTNKSPFCRALTLEILRLGWCCLSSPITCLQFGTFCQYY